MHGGEVFPVIGSILSPEALISEVLPGFAVGEISECKFYSGGFNHTYRVRAADGRTYYLRAYRLPWLRWTISSTSSTCSIT